MNNLKHNNLIILIATHKPFVIPEDDVYLPIHCGRAISSLDKKSLNWMQKNTIGDDTGENISCMNPLFCELTAIYWAWKNYENIGSPERIGLCHYRRYFMDFGSDQEVVAPIYYLHKTIRDQFNCHHDSNQLIQAIDLLPNKELRNCVNEYLDQNVGYFFNMFILPKSIFFEYCGILFPILFELSETSQWENLDRYQRRMPGFLAERLTGGFLYYLEKYRNLCVHKTLPIIPLFGSCSKIRTQTRVTANLSKYIPGFTRIYSKFLSFQTHVLQR